MSVQTALDNIGLRGTARWGHTEYSMGYHTAYLQKVAGVGRDASDFEQRAYDALAFDLHWSTNDGLIDWAEAGRCTDMGHAEYAADGSDRRMPQPSPFKDEYEVWAFDAVAEYGLPAFSEQVAAYEQAHKKAQQRMPGQLTTGGYYKTIVSGAIQSFGWEMLLLGASKPAKMEKVFDSFFRRAAFFMRAWSATSCPVLIQHDDFVWGQGPFMHPDIYRQVLIPRYAELWQEVHAAGKKVLFCADGDFSLFVDDLVAAGADGFIFEPCVDFIAMAERYGQSHCLVGSCVDCRDLAAGDWEKVEGDLLRTFAALEKCRGAIVGTGNHLPPDIPAQILDCYFAFLLPRLLRRV
jgi:hypothetical protein